MFLAKHSRTSVQAAKASAFTRYGNPVKAPIFVILSNQQLTMF